MDDSLGPDGPSHGETMRRVRVLLAVSLALVACQSSDAPGGALPTYDVEATAYCRVVAQPGIVSWQRDLVTRCDGLGAPGETLGACTVSVASGDGSLHPVSGVTGAQLALRVADDGMVLLTDAGQLVLQHGSTMRAIAAWAADPSASPDGTSVAFLALPDGTTEWTEGVPTHVALLDVATGAVTAIAADELASNPYPVGDGSVLFVSTRTGVASLWRGRAHEEPTQLTNVGLDRVDASFVPVPTRDLVWLPGAHTVVFGAHYGVDEIWKVDADSGEAERLGPGTLPQLTASGAVLAETTMTSDANCASRYLDTAGAP